MSSIELNEKVTIPAGIDSLDAFLRWARSDEFPELGRFSYMSGKLWAETEMEQLFTHNQVKAEVCEILRPRVKRQQSGYFFPDGAFLTLPEVEISTVPDAVFVSFASINEGRVRLLNGEATKCTEIVGPRDWVLELVSKSSITKDKTTLRKAYAEAGIGEYWLVDARSEVIEFDILRLTKSGYRARKPKSGWRQSQVFGQGFRFASGVDPLGHPQILLELDEEPR